MTLSELINEILVEWAYRIDDGQPNPNNPKHISELSLVLSEMGLNEIKHDLIQTLTEADSKQFKNPALNKEISYKDKDNKPAKGIIGNLLRLPKDHPGRKAAEAQLPPEGSEERNAMNKDLGSEKDGKSTGGEQPGDDKPKDGEQPQGGGEEEKAKAAQAMFDPKVDPAMGARLDREKKTLDKLAQKDKEDSEEDKIEKPTSAEKPEGEYPPISNPPPQNEKGEVDSDGKIAGTEIEVESGLDEVPKSFLEKISTKMGDWYNHFKDDRLQAEKKAMDVFGYTQQDVNRLSKDKDSAEFKAYDDEVKKHQEPTFNLCSISIPGTNLFCDGNKGITRDKMPQFKGKPEEGSQAWNELEAGKKSGKYKETDTEVEGEPFFRQLLADKDIKVTDAQIAADSLKATQSELVGDKVMGMKSVLDKGPEHPAFKKITAPIFVSKDGYVVDGHHRWAAITAHNIENPDNPLPMNVMIIDKDIDEAIDISNEFASNFGVAAKSGKQTGPQSGENPEPPKDEPSKPNTKPVTDNPEADSIKAHTKTFKGESSGKDIKGIEFDGGAQIFGVQHSDTKMVDDIVNKVKSSIPEEKWKDIVFLGEGGANDENGEMQFNDEVVHAADEFKKMGATIDSWDGDDLDVHKDQSKLYKKQKEKTGLNDNQIKAGNWASMIGQGEGTDTMKPAKFLDDGGKKFLQDAAKEAGLPPIENWDNPTGEKPSEENGWKGSGDRGTLYRLAFPEDNNDKPTKINDIQVAFNETRDENLLEKTKELQAQGKIPISIAGEGHVDLVDDMIKNKNSQPKAEKPEEKLPEPKQANEKPGGVIYSIGGGYYSDTPDGPAQYVKTESIVNGFLLEGDEKWMHLLFEKTVNKVTSGGKTITVSVIEPKDQAKATDAADTAEKESGRQEIDSPKTDKEKEAMRAFTDKSVTDSLSLTKSDIEKQEKKAKLNLLKKIDAWEKRKAKAKAKGQKFTEKKPSVESKGVGLGSPESRAGESAVVKGTLVLKNAFDKCMIKSKDINKCYQAAREATKKHLETYLGSDSFLTKEWIDSAMNTLDLIHKEIGFHNIEEIGWDNQEGRALVGSQGHGTSADMFIKMKPDKEYPNGKRLGISLKKDLKVFIFSGGWKKLEGTMQEKGFILGESSKASHYEKRRNEELHQVSNFAQTNKDEFCKDFDNLKKNPNRLSSKPATVKSRVADILKLTKATDLSKVKCDTFIQNVMSARPLSGDAMKVIGDMCKTSTNPYLKAAYGKMRALDREMTDSIADDFDKPENQTVVKKLVRDETHITDILFADNPNLDELKVVYGTNPAIEMKKEELSKLFGVDDLYAKYQAETDPAKKAEIRKQIEDTIDSKIVISRKKGVMSVAINVNGPDGKPSQLPLFEAKIRTRGFGNAPTFEMSQNTFGGISYKYGHTDYNGVGVDSQGNPNKPWSDEDKSIVVLSMLGDITNDFEEDLDSLDEKTMAEIGGRLQDLDKIYPNHPKVRLFRKKYLESAKQPIERPVPKTASKKPVTKSPDKAPVKKVVTKKPVKRTPAKAPVKKVRR
jgi:hypothetical protein